MKITFIENRNVENLKRKSAIKKECNNIVEKINKISGESLVVGSVFKYKDNVFAITSENEILLVVPGSGMKALERVVNTVIEPEYNLYNKKVYVDKITYKLVNKNSINYSDYEKVYYPYYLYELLKEKKPDLFTEDKCIKVRIDLDLLVEELYIDDWTVWINKKTYDPLDKDFYDNLMEDITIKLLNL